MLTAHYKLQWFRKGNQWQRLLQKDLFQHVVQPGEADDKKTLLAGLTVFVTGKPPPLEDATTVDKPAKVKVEPLNSTEKETQEAQGVVDVSKVLRREFKIHGVVAGDNFKDGLSFAGLVQQIESGIKAGFKETEIV